MAEYINKEQLDRKFIIKMLSPNVTTILDVKEIIDGLQPADVIEISKGATNGDVMKAIFPNIEVNEIKTNTGGYIEVKYLDTTDACDATAFRKPWWNAPYKKEGEE